MRSTALRAVHVCVDDHSRIAFSQILPDERKKSAIAFLKAAVAYYKSLGVTVERVMTDNVLCWEGVRLVGVQISVRQFALAR